MMVSTKGRYALRVMLDLAEHQGMCACEIDNSCDDSKEKAGYVSLADIAERQGLSMKYLEAVVGVLNKGGLVKSLRGKNGGYILAKKPEEYSISEILNLTEGSLAPVECVKDRGDCCDMSRHCATLPLWVGLDNVIENYLGNITLKDLAECNCDKLKVTITNQTVK